MGTAVSDELRTWAQDGVRTSGSWSYAGLSSGASGDAHLPLVDPRPVHGVRGPAGYHDAQTLVFTHATAAEHRQASPVAAPTGRPTSLSGDGRKDPDTRAQSNIYAAAPRAAGHTVVVRAYPGAHSAAVWVPVSLNPRPHLGPAVPPPRVELPTRRRVRAAAARGPVPHRRQPSIHICATRRRGQHRQVKIVHLTDTYAPKLGGIETHIERLAGLQAAAGHTVTILSAHRAGRAGQRSGTAFTVRGDTRAVRVVPALPLQTDDLAADVFHAHLSVTSPATMRTVAFLASTGAPLAVTVHSLWPRWGDAAGAVLRAVGIDQDRVAWSAVSRAAAERVESALLPGRRVDVVPNVVDTAWWHNPRPARHSTTVRAVLVGRLTTRKHVGPFLRALRAAMPPGLAVTVVGDGPRRRHLTHLVRRADLGEQVRFTGALSPRRLRELLHSSDVFVAPAPLESFGIAALEAHAAGLPVLGRCGTGLADFVTDGVDGWLAGSDADLATGLVALTRARDQLHAFQLEAQRRAATLDQAVGVACTERLYDRARFATATTTAADSLALLSAPR